MPQTQHAAVNDHVHMLYTSWKLYLDGGFQWRVQDLTQGGGSLTTGVGMIDFLVLPIKLIFVLFVDTRIESVLYHSSVFQLEL